VQAVTAYRTVDYPADPRLGLPPAGPNAAEAGGGQQAGVLTAAEAKREVLAGRLDAVVAASPSAVRRIHAELAPLGACRFVAIGRSTAAEAAQLGLTVAAIAEAPTASGLVAAVVRSHPSQQPPPQPQGAAPAGQSPADRFPAEHQAKDNT
jgi:hypothetical protein